MTTIWMRHIRANNLCAGGARAWFKSYGFDWRDFTANGIDSERLLATGDDFAKRVVDSAKAEEDGK